MTLQEMLDSRNLPTVDFPATATGWWRRHMELQQLLCREAYGQLPPPPTHMTVREMTVDERFCAGKAPLCKLKLTVTLPGGSFSFPVSLVIPRTEKPCPAIVLINFRPAVPDKYLPSEELADRGYAKRVTRLGIPDRFIEHGKPAELYHMAGLDVESIIKAISRPSL